jgi:hypothetical protein
LEESIRNKIWLGVSGTNRVVFKYPTTPTQSTHELYYGYVIGPFKTMRGANYMAKYGVNNPHCTCVDDVERLAKNDFNTIKTP